MTWHRPFLALGATLALAAAGATSSAQAAEVIRDGSTLILRGAPGEVNHFVVGDDDFSSDKLHFADRGRYGITADPALGCVPSETQFASFSDCPFAGITQVRLEGADGDDELDIDWDELPESIAYVLDGGPGRDHIEGPSGPGLGTTLLGGAGDDLVKGGEDDDLLDGGPGNDDVDGDDGNDVVRGGEGDDVVSGGRRFSTDVVDGGPGWDTSLTDWNDTTQAPQPITVSLDGVADDGRAGENDNVVGLERIRTAVVAQLIAGDDAVEFEIEKSTWGDSRLVGSPGADRLAGYIGNDTIDGRGGRDAIAGLSGDDTIEARDGVADTIDCGDGDDTAFVDPIDAFANCEKVVGGPPQERRPDGRSPDGRAPDTRGPDARGGDGGRARAACRVPKIRRGTTVAAARRALKQARCAGPKLRRVRSGVRRGRVVRVTPKTGSRTRAAVTLFVSRGR